MALRKAGIQGVENRQSAKAPLKPACRRTTGTMRRKFLVRGATRSAPRCCGPRAFLLLSHAAAGRAARPKDPAKWEEGCTVLRADAQFYRTGTGTTGTGTGTGAASFKQVLLQFSWEVFVGTGSGLAPRSSSSCPLPSRPTSNPQARRPAAARQRPLRRAVRSLGTGTHAQLRPRDVLEIARLHVHIL